MRQVGNYPDQCQVVKQQLQDALGITGDIETLPSAAGYAKYGTSRAEGLCRRLGNQLPGRGHGSVYDPDAVYGGVYPEGRHSQLHRLVPTTWWSIGSSARRLSWNPEARREINKEAELFLHSFEDNHWVTLQLGQLFNGWCTSDVKGFAAPVKQCSTSSSTKTCGWIANRRQFVQVM